MRGKLSEVQGDYKTGDFPALPADAVAVRERGDAPDKCQEQHGGRGEQETVHALSPLDTYFYYRPGIRVFLTPNFPEPRSFPLPIVL